MRSSAWHRPHVLLQLLGRPSKFAHLHSVAQSQLLFIFEPSLFIILIAVVESLHTLHVPHVCGHASEAPVLLQRFIFHLTQLQRLKRFLPLINTLNLNVESEQLEAVGGDATGAAVGDVIGAEDFGDAFGTEVGVGAVGGDGDSLTLNTTVHCCGLFES